MSFVKLIRLARDDKLRGYNFDLKTGDSAGCAVLRSIRMRIIHPHPADLTICPKDPGTEVAVG